jgi:hypothetical protein
MLAPILLSVATLGSKKYGNYKGLSEGDLRAFVVQVIAVTARGYEGISRESKKNPRSIDRFCEEAYTQPIRRACKFANAWRKPLSPRPVSHFGAISDKVGE